MPALVPDSLVEQIAVVASPPELVGAIRSRYDGILDRASLHFGIGGGPGEDRSKSFVDAFHAAA